MKLLLTKQRKRFMPFVSNTEVKGHILKTTDEDGVSRFHIQHFLKHGKHHFAAIEVEKLTGQISHIFELKQVPHSSTVTLSVYLRSADSKTSISSVDALARELAVACDDEKAIAEAVKNAYYKNCEFVRRSVVSERDFDFEAIRAGPLETANEYLPSLEDEVVDQNQPKVEVTDESAKKPAEDVKKLPVMVSEVADVAGEVKGPEIPPEDNKDGKESAIVPTLKPAQPYNFQVTPEIPAAALKLFEEKMKMLLEFNNINNGKWKLAETNKNGVTIYEDQKGDFVRILSIFKVPLPFEDVLPFARDMVFRLKYDELLRSIDMVKTYSENMAITRVTIKGSFPVSDREFICYVCYTRLDDDVNFVY
jgi:hypothetical protein